MPSRHLQLPHLFFHAEIVRRESDRHFERSQLSPNEKESFAVRGRKGYGEVIAVMMLCDRFEHKGFSSFTQ